MTGGIGNWGAGNWGAGQDGAGAATGPGLTDPGSGECATQFGALDSDCVSDGDPVNAHVLRTLGRSTSRLVCQSEPLVSFTYDASTDAGYRENSGARELFVFYPEWIRVPLGPAIVPKKPTSRYAECSVIASVGNSNNCWLQIATSAQPFDPFLLPTNDHFVDVDGDGTGNYQTFSSVGDIRLGPGEFERVEVWATGAADGAALDTGTYGSPASGVPTLLGPRRLYYSGASWASALGSDVAGAGHYIVFATASGTYATRPRRITYNETDLIYWDEDLTPGEISFIRNSGASFYIYKITELRIADIALYTKEL